MEWLHESTDKHQIYHWYPSSIHKKTNKYCKWTHINQDYLQFKPSNLNLNLFHYYVIVHKQPLWISWKRGVLDFPTKMKWQIVCSKFFQTESWDTCVHFVGSYNFIENENLKENNLYTHWQKKKCISLPGPEDLSETDFGLNPPTSMLYEPGPRRRF